MACYHPLLAQKTIRPDGKIKMKFFGDFYKQSEDFKKLYPGFLDRDDFVRVPCGQCIGCRLEYSRQWAIRCVLESKLHDFGTCWFITLTYDEEHCLYNSYAVDQDTGEVLYPTRSLVPGDLTKFLKDLRRYYKYHFDHDNIRFFASGEYGSKNMRPHFHIILFNCPIPDLKPFGYQKKTDFTYYESDIFSNVWKKGLVCIGELSFDSCAYVAKYMLKKHKGKDAKLYYDQHGLYPEFSRMSRDPGIARSWYDKYKDKIYEYDSLGISVGGKDYVPKPPSYFDRLFSFEEPETILEIKKHRKEIGMLNEQLRSDRTSLKPGDYALVCEDKIISRMNNLTRKI